jgi:glycosyltransferase involved in cell wall biosynthesis
VKPAAGHVVVIADARFPIAEPFAGGMQSMTWHLVQGLRRRGVDVTVFAGPGSDPCLNARQIGIRPLSLSSAARQDVSMVPEEWMEQHHAYLQLMLQLARAKDVDVVHNNSLHHLPVAMSELMPMPVLTTLHTPPTPWLETAAATHGTARHRFVAVSSHTSRAWAHALGSAPHVIYNGVDLDCWPLGPGGGGLVWFGRIVPEKGTHLAIDIAKAAGRPLRVAGPISDPVYWRGEIEPRLSADIRYVGHLRHVELASLVGSSDVCLVTPAWDEPYGLVAAEALACGTPVLGLLRGGLPEVVAADCALLVPSGDIDAAAEAVPEVESMDRAAARAHAERHCSIDAMLSAYVHLYRDVAGTRAA